jgi:hypothetical protein
LDVGRLVATGIFAGRAETTFVLTGFTLSPELVLSAVPASIVLWLAEFFTGVEEVA